MTVAPTLGALDREIEARADRLRSPSYVMRPDVLGAARLTRYSFSRSMLRRANAEGWTAERTLLDLDADGRGEAVYTVDTGNQQFQFVAFTTTIDESMHTDRVIAGGWEITACLVEGELDAALMGRLRSEIPLQEEGRLDSRVLVLTRGNRSVRFFGYLVDELAAGRQPDTDHVGDAGYIMRSTAFYGNGKCGMRSFAGYPTGHPLAVPYRAQFVCAWMFRELSYDSVEHCARLKGHDDAVGFDDSWRRYFGLGNATGLGLVPYAFKHPRVIDAWATVRELALADVREMAADAERLAALRDWIDRAERHFASGTDEPCEPFLSPRELVPVVQSIRAALDACAGEDRPFDALYRWAESIDAETSEFVTSLLVELHDGDDDLMDDLLAVDEYSSADPSDTAGAALNRIDQRFGWLADLGLETDDADHFWWVVSDNTEEPRRANRSRLEPEGRDVAIDVGLRMWRLRSALAEIDPSTPMSTVLEREPDHRLAVERLEQSNRPFGEPRDNACAADYLPLQIQRFQLAMYGMDNFKPKSTDWLRVTLFQGAPRISDLADGITDDWVLPERPWSTA
ncbi:MAG: hypothetical protein P8J50_02380 [Acidimicrobiales bacterium]|nr:hypothetical protein [Acidimicrobiales bacterium]